VKSFCTTYDISHAAAAKNEIAAHFRSSFRRRRRRRTITIIAFDSEEGKETLSIPNPNVVDRSLASITE
jgi:hypothetical protein